VLTAEGERIAGVVAQLEQAADAVSRTARGLVPDRGELTGEVAISAPPTIANALIAPRLAGLHVRHPKLRLRLLGEKRIASLARREADVALRLTRPTEAGLVTRKVGAFEFALYGARSYLAGRRRAELALIAFDEDGDALPQQKWLLAHAAGRPIALRTNDLESQLAAACAGAGVAVLPSFLVRRHPELERVALRARPVTREVWLVVHDDLRAVASVRAVMELLIEATAELRGR
jgi:DNA-binding transcriptional LysR family regulator